MNVKKFPNGSIQFRIFWLQRPSNEIFYVGGAVFSTFWKTVDVCLRIYVEHFIAGPAMLWKCPWKEKTLGKWAYFPYKFSLQYGMSMETNLYWEIYLIQLKEPMKLVYILKKNRSYNLIFLSEIDRIPDTDLLYSKSLSLLI